MTPEDLKRKFPVGTPTGHTDGFGREIHVGDLVLLADPYSTGQVKWQTTQVSRFSEYNVYCFTRNWRDDYIFFERSVVTHSNGNKEYADHYYNNSKILVLEKYDGTPMDLINYKVMKEC